MEVASPELRSVLSIPEALEKIGTGNLCILSVERRPWFKIYGRSMTVADRLGDDRVIIAKWIRRLTDWNGRQAPLQVWQEKIAPLVAAKLAEQKTPVIRFLDQGTAHRRPGQHRRF